MEKFEQWAIVELFGHHRIAGRVSEQTIAGQGFVRVDVPAVNGKEGFTRLYGTAAIYSIIPTTEEIATAYCTRNGEAPIQTWQLALPSPEEDEEEEESDDENDSFRHYTPDDDPPF